MTTSVADVMADGLARAGASRVFAVDRGDEDGLLEAVGRRGLSVVRVSRAAVACVMAGVSGASDGAPGAAVIGEAPGDASDGLAYAWPDRLPVIVITSGVSAAGGLAAVTEPWGPVHLDVPPAVAAAAAPPVAASCRPAPLPAPGPGALDAALRLLDAAERPLVVVGLLCRSEADGAWVRAFAEARPAPVLVTPKARGVLPDPHPLVIGTLGAGAAERALLESADLVVAVGVDPIEVDPSPWPAETAVLQLTPAAPEAHGPDRVSVVGDIGLILEELAPRLRDRRFAEWDVARLHALKQAAAAPPADAPRLAAYRVVEAARRLTPAGTIAVFEGGDVWPFAARAWQAVAPGECLIPVGPATEGFAVAAATAAQLARPQWRVVCFTDPGAIGTARDQVETLAVLGRPVLIVVLGASGSFAPPAGLRAFAAASIATFTTVFESALACGRPALVTVGAASSQ
jgi:acetolactate synthase-1/2/3 large subunit